MTQLTFRVPLYNVDVRLVQFSGKENAEDVRRCMQWCKIEENGIQDVINALQKGAQNGGDTWRNMNLRKIFVSFYPMTSVTNRVEIYNHEKRHIEDRIMEWANVKDIESAGLLAGFLGTQFYKFEQLILKQ